MQSLPQWPFTPLALPSSQVSGTSTTLLPQTAAEETELREEEEETIQAPFSQFAGGQAGQLRWQAASRVTAVERLFSSQ